MKGLIQDMERKRLSPLTRDANSHVLLRSRTFNSATCTIVLVAAMRLYKGPDP